MKNEFLVLTTSRAVGLSSLPTIFAGADIEALAEAKLEVADLSQRDLRELERNPHVASVSPSMPTVLINAVDVADVLRAQTKSSWGLAEVGAARSEYDGSNVTVAVLDTGIDAKHSAFNGVTLSCKDFTAEGSRDENGHGTHCAGTIFGRDVNGARIGVARGVTTALIGKVLNRRGEGESGWLHRGILWALDEGAHVISVSLGLDFPGAVARMVADGCAIEVATSMALDSYRRNLQMLDALMSVMHAKASLKDGAVVVAAAGNESRRQARPPIRLSASLPAAAAGVLSVGALGRSKDGLVVAPFSNTLPALCAPGVDIVSAKAGGGLRSATGTSMAAPHVAGVAALWWQRLKQQSALTNARNVHAAVLAAASMKALAPNTRPDDSGAGVACGPSPNAPLRSAKITSKRRGRRS